MLITFDPITLLLETYPKEIIWDSNKDICTEMYTTELFIKKNQNYPKYPIMAEWRENYEMEGKGCVLRSW